MTERRPPVRYLILAMGALVVSLATPSLGLAAEPGLAGAEPSLATADSKAGLAVEDLVFCAAIKDRSPAGVADTFPADIYGVYCFTRLTGTRGATAIKHAWYRRGTKAGDVGLAVTRLPWRTWSTKEMRKEWKGDWRVDVLGPDGTVLASKKFFLK
jgi:hypothetical protein